MTAASYLEKDPSYFSGSRPDYVAALPDDPSASILEIGCSDGGTGALALERGKCARYVGIELMPQAAARARGRLSEVRVGDVETMPLDFPPQSFDALIISEVLEHLVDPWRALDRLTPLLRPGARVFASSPNVCHHQVIRNLVRGRWDLADQGIMDRTHLRWFTPASFRAMFEGAGVAVRRLGPLTPFGAKARLVSTLTAGALDYLLIAQISIHGVRR